VVPVLRTAAAKGQGHVPIVERVLLFAQRDDEEDMLRKRLSPSRNCRNSSSYGPRGNRVGRPLPIRQPASAPRQNTLAAKYTSLSRSTLLRSSCVAQCVIRRQARGCVAKAMPLRYDLHQDGLSSLATCRLRRRCEVSITLVTAVLKGSRERVRATAASVTCQVEGGYGSF
jgi:hypothetical protein